MKVAGAGEFEGLIAQMGEAFNKAQSLEDDAKINTAAEGAGAGEGGGGGAGGEGGDAGAAGAGGEGSGDGAGAGEGGEGGEGAGDGEGDDFAKSFGSDAEFEFELADGSKVKGVDGTKLLKSFSEHLEKTSTGSVQAIQGALAVITKQNEVIEKQGAMLKSFGAEVTALKEQVTTLANAGTGRKSIVTTQTPPAQTFNKSEGEEGSPKELLAKCLSAQKLGKISAFDSSRANIAVESGLPIPADIMARLA